MESESFLQSIYRAAPLGIGVVVERVFVQVNQQLCEMLGYRPEELLGKSARLIYPDEAEYERVGREKYAQIDQSGVGSIETRWQRKDGTIIDVLLSSAPIDPADHKKGVTFTALDITARKRMEERLRMAETQYRTLVEQVPAVIYIDRNDDLSTNMYTSPQITALTGYTPEEFLNDPTLWIKTLHPEDRERVLAENQRVNQTGEPFRLDYRVLTKDGRVIWVRDEAVLELDEQGKPSYWRGILMDITAQKEAENRLRLSEEKFAKAFLTSPDSVNINRLSDGLYIDINEGFTRIMGYQREEVIGKSSLELDIWVNPEDRARLVEGLRAKGYVDNLEAPFRAKDGQIRIGLMSARLIELEGELCILSITRDITERKQHERELEAMVQVSAAMRQAFDQVQMINILAQQCRLLFETEQLLILLLNNETAQANVAFASGAWQSLHGQMLSLPGNLQKRESFFFSQESTDPQHAQAIEELFGYRLTDAWVGCFPIRTSLADLGWLCIGRQTPFSSHELRILHAVLDIAASALQRSSLYSQTVQRLHQLNALHVIDRTINASLDITFTANILLAQVVQQLNVAAATLLKFNELSQLFMVLATHQYPQYLIPAIYQLVDDPPRQAVLERRVVTIKNLTGYHADKDFLKRSIGQGYLGYIAVPLVSKGQAKGVLELFTHRELQFTEDWQRFLEALAAQAAIAIDNAEMFETLQRNQSHLSLAYEGVIEGFARALELRDADLHGHSRRVAEITVRLARQFGFDQRSLAQIRHGALLHDIGNLAIAESILQKPGPLTEQEWEVVRKHPEYAFQILSSIPSLQEAVVIPYCHHERWDGKGYPRQLKGESIPLEARLFAVVDVWDALRSDRPYRSAWQRERVLEYLLVQAGKQFDARVVTAFLERVEEFEQIA
jgi:PAS domain S-box-containing protein